MENPQSINCQTIQGTSNNKRNEALDVLITQIQNERTKNYISNRLIPQMEWYSRKGQECKKQYHLWTTITILLGAFIPVVSVFADGSIWVKALLVTLGSIVTACNAYETLHNFKDLWITYRNIREKLLRTLYFYFNNAGVFAQENTQNAKDLLLINICKNEISSEHSEWMSQMQK